jgi:opacity protein-like surface antigen
MAKRRVFMVMAVALLSTVFAAGAFAQVTISGGFALSSIDRVDVLGFDNLEIDPEIGLGGNIYVDYLLPIGIPLSLGVEVGYDTAKFTMKNAIPNADYTEYVDSNEIVAAIPLLLRVAYHVDLMARLDLYLVGKIGYTFGTWEGDYKDFAKKNNATIDDIAGFAFGFDIGAAFYFTSVFGIFVEAGFDSYALEGKIKGSYDSFSYTFEAPFSRFVTVGFSTKF